MPANGHRNTRPVLLSRISRLFWHPDRIKPSLNRVRLLHPPPGTDSPVELSITEGEQVMLTETTVSKLRKMRLSVMANALKDQFADPQFQSMAFEDRLGLLVDAEWNARKNNHLNKLIRQATFSDPGACLENVEYLPDRGLKQEELLRFGTCNYIQEHHNIILLGATGSGKTYLACALGMAAARRFYAVKYIRLPDLLVEF